MLKTIEVTQHDIDNSHCGEIYECAVAVAIRRQTGQKVSVDGQLVYFYGDKQFDDFMYSNYTRLPSWVTQWIVSYDRREKVEPITFELEVPE
jgi:hypothetical protein